MLCLAAKMQQTEMGDATNFVITFAGAMLREAEGLPLLAQEAITGNESPFSLAEYNLFDYMPNWVQPLVGTREERIERCIEGWGPVTRPVAFWACDYHELAAQRATGAGNQWPFGDADLLHKAGLWLSKDEESAYRKARPGWLKNPPVEVVEFPTAKETV